MAISKLEQDTVSRACQAAAKVIRELYPVLKELNIVYDSSGGVKSTLDQAKLDSVASFSGVTKSQVDDGLYALTATLRGDIEGAFAQLAEIAARG